MSLKKKTVKTVKKPVIDYPPVTTRKWKPPSKDLPHDPHKKQEFKRQPLYPKNEKVPHSTVPKAWHNFKLLSRSIFILRGSFSQNNPKYLLKSRGFQGPATNLMAIALSALIPMEKWTSGIIDKVVKDGDSLYLNTMKVKKECHQPTDVIQVFFIGKTQVTMDTNKDQVIRGKVYKELDKDIPLLDALKTFFRSKTSCICQIGKVIVSIWTSSNQYYYFDPSDTDDKGLRCKTLGVASLIRTNDINNIFVRIIQNINLYPTIGIPRFILYPIKVKNVQTLPLKAPQNIKELKTNTNVLQKENISAKVKTQVKKSIKEESKCIIKSSEVVETIETIQEPEIKQRPPTPTYFTILLPNRMGILQASMHMYDPLFGVNGGVQAPSIALVALSTLATCKAKTWISKMLDKIICSGDENYVEAMKETMGDEQISLKMLSKKIALDDRCYKADLEECIFGLLISQVATSVDLLQALEEFFADNDAGIIKGPLIIAVWMEDEKYYIFDPYERDRVGKAISRHRYHLEVRPERGFGCLLWFSNLKDLVAVYMNNVDKNSKRDPFVITKVQVSPYVELPENWNGFKTLSQRKWILRGHFSQNDIRFNESSRNTQCTVCSTISLCYMLLKPLGNWQRDDVDNIVIAGDTLWTETIDKLVALGSFKSKMLLPTELPTTFTACGQTFIIEVEECLINGVLTMSDEDEVPNLRKALAEFFEDNMSGVITSNNLTIAVSREENDYFYFDSHGRGPDGFGEYYGTACIQRFLNTDDLSAAIHSNLYCADAVQYNMFNVHKITPTLFKAANDIRLDEYLSLENKAILRGNMHQGMKLVWDTSAGKQTIPNAIVAAAMVSVIPAKKWKTDTLDEILCLGNEIYEKTRELEYKKMMNGEKLDPNIVTFETCIKDIKIGMNRITVSCESPVHCIVKQQSSALPEEAELKTLLNDTMIAAPGQCLVVHKVFAVAVWKDEEYFYVFDPKGRDMNGSVVGSWELPYEDEHMSVYEMEEDGESFVEDAPEGDENCSVPESVDDCEARCCTLAFSSIDNIVEHLLSMIPPKCKKTVTFYPLALQNKVERRQRTDPNEKSLGNWYNFQEVELGKWILRGTLNYEDELFPTTNRGKQQESIAVISSIFVHAYNVSKFSMQYVEKILKYGDKLHTAAIRQMRFDLKANKNLHLTDEEIEIVLSETPVTTKDVKTKLSVSQKLCHFNVMDVVEGDVTANEMDEIPDLKRALECLFESNKHGIVLVKGTALCVFQYGGSYFMLDPASRGPSGLKETNGVACFTRFSGITQLAELIKKNLPKEGLNTFKIQTLQIKRVESIEPGTKIEPTQTSDISAFKCISSSMRILRGTFEIDNIARPGVLAAPVSMVAIGMAHVHKSLTWTKPIVDEVLTIAKDLYDRTVKKNENFFNPWKDDMMVEVLLRTFKIGKWSIEVNFKDEETGILYIKDPYTMNLRASCQKFFRTHHFGVIQSNPCTVSIWEDAKIYFLFDPYSRGKTGLYQSNGTACVLAFESPALLSEHILKNIPTYRRNEVFKIMGVEVTMREESVKKKTPVKFDLYNAEKIEKFIRAESESVHDASKKKVKETKTGTPSRTKPETKAKKSPSKKTEVKTSNGHEMKKMCNGLYPIGGGVKILRCHISQNSSKYSKESRNKQSICNACVAITMAHLHPIMNWTMSNLEIILDSANTLYEESRMIFKSSSVYLNLKQVQRKLYVGKIKMNLVIFNSSYKGSFNKQSLTDACTKFLTIELKGIFFVGDTYIAFFRTKQHEYLFFEPWPRDSAGMPASDGTACLLYFPNISSMVDKLMQIHHDITEDQTFAIVAIDAETDAEREKRIKKKL